LSHFYSFFALLIDTSSSGWAALSWPNSETLYYFF
jgi:hypothetical protein